MDETDLARIGVQVSSQQITQDPVCDNEAPPVALEAKPHAAISLVIRERRIVRLGSDIQTNAPTLNGVHHPPHPPSPTPSARATTISRGPSNGSLPWAVRMLSTTSTSPACHGSRTGLAS